MSAIQEPWRKSKWSTNVVCNKYCPGRKMTRPSLQCIECKSFFHPECIFFNVKDAKRIKNTFTCTKCHLRNDPNALKIRIKMVDLCPMLKLSFDCLLKIFSFLSISDLQSVARVCSTWKYVCTQPILWRQVSFNGVLVKDWTLAEKCLAVSSVQRLDFRGMVIEDKKTESMWRKIANFLHSMEHLKYLDFGRVSATVLHHIAGSLSSLEVLTAEWITDAVRNGEETDWETGVAWIDMRKFSHLKNLKELRLRASCAGLQLPLIVFGSAMIGLKELKQLRKLSLTTFRRLTAQDFAFLSYLEQLQSLELGDCLEWEAQTFEYLSKLTDLRHLRLERVGSATDGSLGRGLVSLRNLAHLELIMCQVPETFARDLMEIPSLQTLSIWPDTFCEQACQVNTNCLAAIISLQQLHLLDWGVLTNNETTRDIVFNYGSFCKQQATNNGPTIKFSKTLKDVLFDNVSDLQYVQHVASENIFLSATQLTKILTNKLPSTHVRVLPVPMNVMERLYFVI